MKKIISILLISLFLAASFAVGESQAASKSDKKPVILKYAGVLPYDHPTSRAIEEWAKHLETKSGGKIVIQLYHSGSMGKSTEVAEYLQDGTIAFSNISTAFFSGFNKKFDVFSLPYLFRDDKHMQAALTGDFGTMIKELLIKDGIRGLAFIDSGSRSVYTKGKAINSPSDMSGLKIRVMSKVAVNSMNALGANGVPIPWGELYTSLQTGVVDAAENNPPSIIAGKHYEVCTNYSLTQHFRTPDLFVISASIYNKLGTELQKVLNDSITDFLIPTQSKMFADSTKKSMEQITSLGMKINTISNLSPFIEKTAIVRKEVAKSIGMMEWVNKISNM